MKLFYYYKNDGKTWEDKKLLWVIEADNILEADKEFLNKVGIDSAKAKDISVSLEPLKNLSGNNL